MVMLIEVKGKVYEESLQISAGILINSGAYPNTF